jgi:hypothetical protein
VIFARSGLAGSCRLARAGPACGGVAVAAVPSKLAGALAALSAAGVRSSRPRETLGREEASGEERAAFAGEAAFGDGGATDSLCTCLRESGRGAAACGVRSGAAPSPPDAARCSPAGGEDGAGPGDAAGAGVALRERRMVDGACTGSLGASVASVREGPAGGCVARAGLSGLRAAVGVTRGGGGDGSWLEVDAGVRATRLTGGTGAVGVVVPAPGVGSESLSTGATAAGGGGCAAGAEPGGMAGPVAWPSAGLAVGTSGGADRGVAVGAGGTGVGAAGAGVGVGVRDRRWAGPAAVGGGGAPAAGAADREAGGADAAERSDAPAAGWAWGGAGAVGSGGGAAAGGAVRGSGGGRSAGPSRILAPRPCPRPPSGGRRDSLRSGRGFSVG